MQQNLKLLLVFLLLFVQFEIAAQNSFHFSHFGMESGLTQNSVYQIFQDSNGFLWFGTRNGLNRYNGYEVDSYKNEVNNPQSLSNSFIQAINEDKNRNIWIGTANGLNRINHISGEITRFYPRDVDISITTNAIEHLIRLNDGRLFAIWRNKILICNPDNTVELHKELTDVTSHIHAITQAANQHIYIATQANILIYSQEWELKKNISAETSNFPQSDITSLLPDATGIWIGTANHGIYYFENESQTFSRYDTHNTQLSTNIIRALQFLNSDSILIGTFEGLYVMNLTDRNISPIQTNMGRYGEFTPFSILSMLVDRDGTLWLGTYATGISYWSPYKKAISLISSNEYLGITIGKGQEDGDGNIWFVTEGGGLLFYNPYTSERRLYPLEPLSAGNRKTNMFTAIAIDGDIIYCGTLLGTVYKFHISQRRFELLHTFGGLGIRSLMLLSTTNRLRTPSSGRSRMVVFEEGRMIHIFYYDEANRLIISQINNLFETKENVFLVGSSYGDIFLHDLNDLIVENIRARITLGEHEQIGVVSSVAKDAMYIYVATTGLGLLQFDHEMQFIKHYGYENGMRDSFISALVVDNDNNLWVATGNDIFRLNRETNQFYSINITGSFSQAFTKNAAFVASDGTLYFPGNRGVISFNPQNWVSNPILPPVFITSLMSNNEDIRHRIEPKGNNKYTITLRSNENNLTIGYVALNFIHSYGNRYRIRMDNIDEMWHDVAGRREAHYGNLRPGHYTFRIKASNNDGVWNPNETTLSIHIKPPFYQTAGAYAVYILLILTILYFIDRYRRRRIRLESEIRLKQMEQDNLTALHNERMRMYANFSHELKTPLTLIMNPLQELTQRAFFSQEVKDALQKMKKNTSKMLVLVERLMDIQKYEAKKVRCIKSTFNFSSFMEEIFESFQQTAKSREINFQIINKLPTVYVASLDKTEIEKIFLNLLSNAFKFTPSGGTVTMTVQSVRETGNPYLQVEIADTGQGFSKEEAKMIFEPFYQLGNDLHKQLSGTGIGLSLVRSIVAQHEGLIKVSSQEQIGSTFTVLLPDTEKQPIDAVHAALSEKQQETNNLIEQQNEQAKKTILLAENETDILDYLEEKLSPFYTVLRAENGKQALSVIEQKMPDLVVSDIVMPEMNGIELSRYLKKHQKYSHIPIILLTGQSDENQKMKGFDVGADAYITKPFSIDFLKVRIKNLVENREKVKTVFNDARLFETLGIDKTQYKNEFILKCIEFVRANISNQDLNVTDIHNGLGISRTKLYRKLREATRLSPIDLIKHIRLDASVKLLAKSDKNMSEIAEIVGFSTHSVFTREFKKEYGVSPSEYRQA
jgi:signal transduction histidine kinase/CheY-like chemotaxis protein/ligand-binding sensor domain-containing protein/AraC-like DNA-binding protein